METKWLEDFLTMAETLNFSRSAKLRNVTQPAFCRRIRSLETWVGAELFDRSTFPARLTPSGQIFLLHARDMLKQTQAVRALLREQAPGMRPMLQFAMPHTLSLTYFPNWLNQVEQAIGCLPLRIEACNTHEAVQQMVEGNCDLLMCYQHPQQSIGLDSDRFESMAVGIDYLLPYAKGGEDGRPVHSLPGNAGQPVPMLAYPQETVLGQIVARVLEEESCPAQVYRRFESDLAVGLKMMALHGHGIAWLPQSMVSEELASGALVPAIALAQAGEGRLPWSVKLEIRLYRAREPGVPEIDAIWQHVASRQPEQEI